MIRGRAGWCVALLTAVLVAPAMADFVHPGAWSSREELDFVRGRVAAGAQPWAGEVERLRAPGLADRVARRWGRVDSAGPDAGESRDDAAAAYAQALRWRLAGDADSGRRAVAGLNAWAGFQGFTAGTDQDRLQAGWIGAVLAQAAELMRDHPDWRPGDVRACQAMFRRAFYPPLQEASAWNGNVDLTQIDAWISVAVFNDDRAAFGRAVQRWRDRVPAYIYLTTDGPGPRAVRGDGGNPAAFWGHPLKWVDGLMQESCRDNGHHAQYGLGSALHAAEVAWHQGVDLYGEEAARLVAAMERLAGQLLSGSMQGVARQDAATASRFNTWEMGYHHFHGRRGMSLPNTRRLIVEQVRPRSERLAWNLALETLTHGDLPAGL